MNLTVLLTNWKRNKNLSQIVQKLRLQTMDSNLIVIDNSFSNPESKFFCDDGRATIIEEDNSKMCWARWEQAVKVETKYVCIMDDDLIFSRDGVLMDCFNYMETNTDIDCIGLEGVKLMKSKKYFECEHQQAKSNHTINVSVVKGRFMFVRTESLKGLDMTPDTTCDDIKVSSHLRKKTLPSILSNSFDELPQGSEALSGKQYQSIKRDYAAKRYFRN